MDDRVGKLLGACLAAAEGGLPVDRMPTPRASDIAAVVDLIHGDMARGEAARAARAVDHGHSIACHEGCDFCCANLIVVYHPEAMRVARWLGEREHRAARQQFERAYPRWQAEIGDDANRLMKLHEGGEIEAAETLYAEVQDRHVPCAFVADGRCVIHPVRPNVCRNAFALDTPDRCRPGSAERPLAIAFPPVSDFVERASAVFRVLHRRLYGAKAPSALCDEVHQLLQQPPGDAVTAPSRNAPCPCGSGRKFKGCCGA